MPLPTHEESSVHGLLKHLDALVEEVRQKRPRSHFPNLIAYRKQHGALKTNRAVRAAIVEGERELGRGVF